jgi:hypothetical protein
MTNPELNNYILTEDRQILEIFIAKTLKQTPNVDIDFNIILYGGHTIRFTVKRGRFIQKIKNLLKI